MAKKRTPSRKSHWERRKSRIHQQAAEKTQTEADLAREARIQEQSRKRCRDYRWKKKVRATPSALKEKNHHKLTYQSVFVLPSELLECVFSSVGWEDWVALSSTCTLFEFVVASMVERVVQSFPAGTHEKDC